MKMFGNHVGKKLSALHHGELSESEARRAADHLRDCRRCRNEYQEIRFGAQLASQLAMAKAPESLWPEIERQTRRTAAGRSGFEFKLPILAFGTAVLIVGVWAFWVYLSGQRERVLPAEQRPSWEVTKLDGRPVIETQAIEEKGRLALGQLLVTDESSRAQISIGEIGEVKIEPGSRVRLVSAQENDHRLAMDRGKMEAFIWAPPGKFFVDTPSARAIDLGCSYTLEVSEGGAGLLRVTMGWVAFEWKGRESFVPAGAMCATRPGIGPGIPYFEDSAKELAAAVEKFDLAGDDKVTRAEALNTIFLQSRKSDALTLWHLLTRTDADERNLVFDRLAALVPPPASVTRDGILQSDRAMLDSWWESLGHGDASWWRTWKGKIPQ